MYLLWYMTNATVENFIDMIFYIMNAGTKVYYVYLFVLLEKNLVQMLTSLTTLRKFRSKISTANKLEISSIKYAIKLGLSSIVMSVISTIWYYGVAEWTPKTAILDNSYSTGVGLFVWTKQNMENGTYLSSIDVEYGTEFNTNTLILGSFGMILTFCSNVHNQVTGDLMQTNAETLKMEMKSLQVKIKNTENDEKNGRLDGFFREDGEWMHSRLLNHAVHHSNNALDILMKCKHVNNLMLFVFFVLNVFDGQLSLAFLAYLVYNVCKSSYTYRIAAKASSLVGPRIKKNNGHFHNIQIPIMT